MTDARLNRREFLLAGASALIAPRGARALGPGAPFFQSQKGWIPMRVTGSIGARSQAATRDAGNYVFMYGGLSAASTYQSTTAWFDPANNAWQVITPTSGAAPIGRFNHIVATSGSHFFTWGGSGSAGRLASGGLYLPTSLGANGGTWVTASTTSAPAARELCTIVWCGSKYIVWGGKNGTTYYNDGGIYDPVANSWTPLPAPSNVTISARSNHAAVATNDNRMIIFGGTNGSVQPDAFIYDLTANAWSALPNSPWFSSNWGTALAYTWTGTQAFFWGGGAPIGAIYTLASNSWALVSSTNAPTGGAGAQAWWSGSKVIMADGQNNYGIYNPVADAWTSIPTTNGPISTNSSPCIGYANRRLCYWGGVISGTRQNSGKMYYQPAYL